MQAFRKAGWQVAGRVGSHVVISKPGIRANLAIPQPKELSIGTLRVLIHHVGMSLDSWHSSNLETPFFPLRSIFSPRPLLSIACDSAEPSEIRFVAWFVA